MKVIHRIKIHLDDKRGPTPSVDVMQGDAYTRQLEFSLYSGGEAWNVPDGVSVAVAYHGASGHGIYNRLPDNSMSYAVSGNVVTVTLIPQVAAVAGKTTVTVVFADVNGKQLATFGVVIDVCRNPAVGAGKPKDYINLWDWIGPQAEPEAGISFVSSADEVTVAMRGRGTVRIFAGTNYQAVELSEDGCEVTIANPDGTIRIDGIAGLTELDLHSQRIRSFTAEVECDLRKLVLYHNSLTELDCSNFKSLQILHVHNNPLCDEDVHRDALRACMASLPDRCTAATGSVVLYPWYGLEILICKDAEGNYIKYPAGFSELQLLEGKLYGLVEDGSITYYTYAGGELVLHDAMNRHHALRKQLEADICLKRNWVFGSAIRYSDDWARCPWDFRQSHIADMWETAEKGFGLTLGIIDKFTQTVPGFRYYNVKDLRCISEDGTELAEPMDYLDAANADKANYQSYLEGDWQHGDCQLSVLFGHGITEGVSGDRFGYIPNACCYLIDKVTEGGSSGLPGEAYLTALPALIAASDAISISWSMPTGYDFSAERNLLGAFGEKNIYVYCTGNGGDAKPYTLESTGKYAVLGGNYTIDGVEKPSTALFVGACSPDKVVSGFSSSSIDADLEGLDRESYLCCYGDQLYVVDNLTKKFKTVAGTSYAAPLCCGILMLMRNVYARMYPAEISFGKRSSFMNHVRKRWCDHLENQMDTAAGYGIPDILAEPYAPKLLTAAPDVDHLDAVMLGDALDISYAGQKYAKQGFTPEYRPGEIAVTRDGKIYPLFAKDLTLRLYSNSSRKAPESYSENWYASDIEVEVLPNAVGEVGGALSLTEKTLTNDAYGIEQEPVVQVADEALTGREFTVQFALDFSDKLYPADAGEYTTSRELLYFRNLYQGADLGRLLLDKISYTAGNAHITMKSSSRFDHGYFSDLTERTTSYAMGMGMGPALDLDATPYGIVTMTCGKDGVNYFFNGTHIGRIVNIPDIQIPIVNVYVNKGSLCHDAVGCVRIYDRVLTDEEIVRNTIFLLNSHFEEG